MNTLSNLQMQEIVGGKEMSAECIFALAAAGFTVAGLVFATGPIAAAGFATAISAGDAAAFIAALFGSGFAGKDIILNCF